MILTEDNKKNSHSRSKWKSSLRAITCLSVSNLPLLKWAQMSNAVFAQETHSLRANHPGDGVTAFDRVNPSARPRGIRTMISPFANQIVARNATRIMIIHNPLVTEIIHCAPVSFPLIFVRTNHSDMSLVITDNAVACSFVQHVQQCPRQS